MSETQAVTTRIAPSDVQNLDRVARALGTTRAQLLRRIVLNGIDAEARRYAEAQRGNRAAFPIPGATP